MSTVKLQGGKAVLKGGKVACTCCGVRVEVTCESYTGEVQLCGWSGYRPDGNTQTDNDPTAPWQGRKWRFRRIIGTLEQRFFHDSSCTTCDQVFDFTWDTADLEAFCDGTFQTTTRTDTGTVGFGDCTTIASTTTSSESTVLGPVGALAPVVTLTSRTRTGPNTCSGSVIVSGTASETLTDELDLADETISQNPTPDDPPVCCASTGTPSLTSPESTAPITYGTSTAVVLKISIRGGAPSTAYDVTLNFDDSSTTVLTITTNSLGEADDEYTIPQPDAGEELCFTSATIAPAP